MKKLIVIMLVGLFISWPAVVQAEEEMIGVYSGINYNTYSFEYHNDLAENMEHGQKINGGLGYFVGLRGWLSDKLAVGVEIEKLRADSEVLYLENDPPEDGEIKYWYAEQFFATSEGLLLTLNYDLSAEENLDSRVLAILGLGKYRTNLSLDNFNFKKDKQYEETKTCLGGKIGVETKQQVTDNLIFSGRLLYRSADIKSDLESNCGHNIVDLSGLEFSANLTLGF